MRFYTFTAELSNNKISLHDATASQINMILYNIAQGNYTLSGGYPVEDFIEQAKIMLVARSLRL
jgi:hypothetical protein